MNVPTLPTCPISKTPDANSHGMEEISHRTSRLSIKVHMQVEVRVMQTEDAPVEKDFTEKLPDCLRFHEDDA
jgi:hypothetical protein